MSDKPDGNARFARLFSDGSLTVETAGIDFLTARQRLLESNDDTDVEILEVDIKIIRTYGKPKLRPVYGDTGFSREDFAHMSKLLRQHSAPEVAELLQKYPNQEGNLKAVLSNNLNIILAAIDLAAAEGQIS
jgi:hypothetical protein